MYNFKMKHEEIIKDILCSKYKRMLDFLKKLKTFVQMDVYLSLIQELPVSIQLQIEQKVGIYLVSLGCIKKKIQVIWDWWSILCLKF